MSNEELYEWFQMGQIKVTCSMYHKEEMRDTQKAEGKSAVRSFLAMHNNLIGTEIRIFVTLASSATSANSNKCFLIFCLCNISYMVCSYWKTKNVHWFPTKSTILGLYGFY